MAYATQQEMSDRVGADDLALVADREGDGALDTEAITGALDDATAEIDSYLAARYGLPLAEVPATVKRVCIDMAMYHLSGNKTTEEVEKRYQRAVAWLRDVSKGLATLGAAPDETTSQGAFFEAAGRITGRTRMSGGF